MLFLKNLVFTVLVPGTVAVYVPYRLLGASRRLALGDVRPLRWLGIALVLGGALLYLVCVLNFAVIGRGTPAPIDPPKSLVVSGPYKVCRNPIYIAVISVIFGLSWVYASPQTFLYGLAVWAAFHAFVVFYEEPTLRRSFGPAFDRYCATVPRWHLRWPPPRGAGSQR